MLHRLGAWVIRRRYWVLLACVAISIAAAVLERGLFGRLGYAVFYDPASESTRGAALARAELGEGDPDVIALYRLPEDIAPKRGFDDPRVHAALTLALERIGQDPDVTRVAGAIGPLASRFVSSDRRCTFVVISMRGNPRTKVAHLARIETLAGLQLLRQSAVPITVRPKVGGLVPAGRALTRMARQSLARGERIALPLTALLLVFIFGSLVAALLPVAIGGLSIVLALAVLDLLARVLSVDAFAVNVVTILGLGVAIDYALFIVNRYREEVRRSPPDALVRTVASAGRSVLFSGVTVAASLAGLLVFRQPFLRSVAFGGMAVTLIAALLALVVLPAGLFILGRHLERGRIPWLQRLSSKPPRGVFWRWLAHAVIRRRVLVAVGVTVSLMVLAAPFRRLQPSRADVRALPASEEPRQVSEALMREFPEATNVPMSLLLTMDGDVADSERMGRLYDYVQRLQAIPGVVRAESILYHARVRDRDDAEELASRIAAYAARTTSVPTAQPGLRAILNGHHTVLRIISAAPADSSQGHQLVRAVRRVARPPGSQVLVFGQAAALYDFATSLRERTPWMIAIVFATMFFILFLAFRSAVLPVKAMLMTALSLTASFGATVFIFQDGRLQRVLGYHALGTTDATLPVLMFAVVFGLSMDYEVLILSRIRETYLRTGRNDEAVVDGLAKTGRLVSGAALLMVVVFAAFAATPLVFVKALGLGMALAVALDATVVRMLLVPSTMALLGRLNWWAPGRHM